MGFRDANGVALKMGRVYVSIYNPNYLCWLDFQEGSDFGFLDINSPDLKYASEMFNGWSRSLTPVQNLDTFVKQLKESIEFLERIRRQKH